MFCPSYSCKLLWSYKEIEQSRYVAAIAAWHTSEKCQRSGAYKVGSLKVPFEVLPLFPLSFSPLFSFTVSLYILESCIPLSFPTADSCECANTWFYITDRHCIKFVIHVSYQHCLLSLSWLLETVQTVHCVCVIQALGKMMQNCLRAHVRACVHATLFAPANGRPGITD